MADVVKLQMDMEEWKKWPVAAILTQALVRTRVRVLY